MKKHTRSKVQTSHFDAEPPGGRHIATAAGSLFVEERGTGPTLVFWHALLCEKSMWQKQANELSNHYHLLLIDGPGHGRSHATRQPFTYAHCADALVQILDAHQVQRAVLVGLGWGGHVSLLAALHAPERVRGLVLFDTSITPHARFDLRVPMMAELIRWSGVNSIVVDSLLRTFFTPLTRKEQPDLIEDCTRWLHHLDRRGIYNAMRSLRRFPSFDGLADLRVPTLVLVGEHDHVYSPQQNEHLANAIGGAVLERLSHAGHLSVLEAPEQANRLLSRFLAQLKEKEEVHGKFTEEVQQ